MKHAMVLLLVVMGGLAVQNNFPALQLLVLVLPLSVLCALKLYQSPSNQIMAIAGVCLLYGSLSGAFVYAASVGLISLIAVLVLSRWRLSLVWAGLGIALVTQAGFVIASSGADGLMMIGFALQLIVILVVSLQLEKGRSNVRI